MSEITERLKLDPGVPQKTPTKSYWQSPVHESVSKIQSSQLPQECDVIIIGSGITGCSAARHLLQGNDSLKITVLEARTITSGATGRNGGHVKAVPEYSFAELRHSLGNDEADQVIRFTLANVDELMKVKDELSPELRKFSEVRRVESLNLFTDEGAFAEFHELLEAYEQTHQRKGHMVYREELVNVGRMG